MASKMIVLRQRVAASIRAALATFGEEVTPALEERAGPFLDDGESALDFRLFVGLLERMVAASLERLVEADKDHLDELAGDVAGRLARDGAVAALRQKLIDIRSLVMALFGRRRAIEIVAVDGRTAAQPELLWRQGEHTLTRLRDPQLRIPPRRRRPSGSTPQSSPTSSSPWSRTCAGGSTRSRSIKRRRR